MSGRGNVGAVFTVIVALALGASCTNETPAGPVDDPDGADGRVAAAVLEVSATEIDAGELARSRSSDPDVLAFAARIVADHTAIMARMQVLIDSKGIRPEDSQVRQFIAEQAAEIIDSLRVAPADSLDLGYVDSRVTMQALELQLLYSRMLPVTDDADLTSELFAIRDTVDALLIQAQELRPTLPHAAERPGLNTDDTGTVTEEDHMP